MIAAQFEGIILFGSSSFDKLACFRLMRKFILTDKWGFWERNNHTNKESHVTQIT